MQGAELTLDTVTAAVTLRSWCCGLTVGVGGVR